MPLELALVNPEVSLPFSVHLLKPGQHLVGRSLRCDLPMFDLTISRQHAKLIVTDQEIRVIDLGSSNGTFINNQQIQDGPARVGDELRFGRIGFRVRQQQGVTPPANFFEIETVRHAEGDPPRPPDLWEGLSSMRQRVLACLLDGLTQREIADQLGMSEHTVHNHVRKIYDQLEVHSRGQLLAKFIQDKPTFLDDPETPA